MLTTMGATSAAAAVTGAAAAGTFASTAMTVVGGLSSIMSGFQESSAFKQQAIDEETRAVQETITGRQDALDALRNMNQDQARIAVAGYDSGSGAAGSVAAAQEEARKIGEQNISVAREGATIRSEARRSQAGQFRRSASGAVLGGISGAIKGGLSLFNRREVRG